MAPAFRTNSANTPRNASFAWIKAAARPASSRPRLVGGIMKLRGGRFELDDNQPGLVARLIFDRLKSSAGKPGA